MSSAPTLTIAFTGLMVFRPQGRDLFEIGILPAEHHYLRINTLVHHQTVGSYEIPDGLGRIWELEVAGPVGQGVSVHEHSDGTFKRSSLDRDFRWMIDLESVEFYGENLEEKMDTGLLRPLLRIRSGKFYTSEKSPELKRRKGEGDFETFGSVAAYIGCDIQLTGAGARLVADGQEVFDFKREDDTTYEVINAPLPEHLRPGTPGEDHFQHYYQLFPEPIERFGFTRKVPQAETLGPLEKDEQALRRAPRPQLCGAVLLGRRTKPLG